MLQVLWLTFKLAFSTTLILLVLATPLALWLSRSGRPWRATVGALVGLPVVLPPTVLGFYLLILLGPDSPLMAPLQPFGVRTLAFTFEGLVIGSVIYSLPFAVQPLRNAFESIDPHSLEVAQTLGASPLHVFWRVAFPLALPGYFLAAILVFAHTIGEFGVVLMLGGGIPGETEVLSIEVWRLVEALEWREAHLLAGLMAGFGFLVVFVLLLVERRMGRRGGDSN